MENGKPPLFILAVDWGKGAKKRAAYQANVSERRIQRIAFDGSLMHLIQHAKGLASPTLIGIDAAIGFPHAAWQNLNHNHQTPSDNFMDFLLGPHLPNDFFDSVSDPEHWSPAHPFIKPPRKWSRKAFEEASDGGFYRIIDSALKGNPIFITSGMPGTVGSGTRALWQELISLRQSAEFSVWPFHGKLGTLLHHDHPTIAEIYPKACYGLALSDSLPANLLSLAKTRRETRDAALAKLLKSNWVKEFHVEIFDVQNARSNEDDFDALMSAAALLRLFLERAPIENESAPHLAIEGDVLGAASVITGASKTFPSPSRRPTKTSDSVPSTKVFSCPIPGCDKVFRDSRGGWDAHIASIKRHPNWHPEATDAEERKRLFKEEYPGWFRN